MNNCCSLGQHIDDSDLNVCLSLPYIKHFSSLQLVSMSCRVVWPIPNLIVQWINEGKWDNTDMHTLENLKVHITQSQVPSISSARRLLNA